MGQIAASAGWLLLELYLGHCDAYPLPSRGDWPAVVAATTCQASNGQTEGQVHKLKLIKRQTFGRAGFALLRKRVLQTV